MHHQHGGQFLDIDRFAVNSKLAHVNPELKVSIGVLSLFACLMSKVGFTAIIIAAAMIIMTLVFGKIDFQVYCRMLMIPFSFILLSGIVLLLDISSFQQDLIDIPVGGYYLSVTPKSVITTAKVSIKALSCVNCLYMISLSTPIHEVIGVLKRIRLPQIMIEFMYLLYRFIFILLQSFSNMNTSAGARLGYCGFKHSYHTFFGICTNLLVVAFKKASASFDAMEARCYEGTLLFLEQEKRVTGKQLVSMGTYVVIVVVMLILERML
jgi:cobalt/nickel transport system permease protein